MSSKSAHQLRGWRVLWCRSEAGLVAGRGSCDHRHAHREDSLEIARNPTPGCAFIAAVPHLTAGGSEVQADWIAFVACQRLSQHGVPCLLARQSAILPFPGFTRITGAICGWFAIDGRARPHRGSIHGKDPGGGGIARMKHDAESDVADCLWHVAPDAFPFVARTIDSIDAAMALLIETVRHHRMNLQ